MDYSEWFKFIDERPNGGIELIQSHYRSIDSFSQDELEDFFNRCLADDYTFQRFSGIKQLRVWEAMALHYYLDPAVVGLNRKGRLGELLRASRKLRDCHLLEFVKAIQNLLSHIAEGKLVCTKANNDLLLSFTTIKNFRAYVEIYRITKIMRRDTERTKKNSVQPSLPHPINILWEANELWKTTESGGTVIPGNYSTEPDVPKFFAGRGYSANQSRVLASFLRPSFAHVGRPPTSPKVAKF